jgi:hypothetical protein
MGLLAMGEFFANVAKKVGVSSPHKSNILISNNAIEIKESVGSLGRGTGEQRGYA